VRYTETGPVISQSQGLGLLASISRYDRETQVADANLMAAAPSLLGALEEFRSMLNEGYVVTGPDVTRVLKLIIKVDSVLIPLRSKK
jgi:acyl-homoserine lactone acylase PvdQ